MIRVSHLSGIPHFDSPHHCSESRSPLKARAIRRCSRVYVAAPLQMVTAVTAVPRHLGVHTSRCHAYLFSPTRSSPHRSAESIRNLAQLTFETSAMADQQVIPARGGRAARVKRGETIRVVNTHGTQVIDT